MRRKGRCIPANVRVNRHGENEFLFLSSTKNQKLLGMSKVDVPIVVRKHVLPELLEIPWAYLGKGRYVRTKFESIYCSVLPSRENSDWTL